MNPPTEEESESPPTEEESESPPTEEESERLYLASFIDKRAAYLRRKPPTQILRFPDIFEDAWGWERILPQDDFCSMPFYLNYLKEYLLRNRTDYVTAADGTSNPENWPLEIREVGAVTEGRRNGKDALTTAAEFCLDMEQQLMSEWESQPIRNVNVKLLSERIQERACYVIHMGREFSEPAAASLVCIANEAALASELLRHGAKATDNEFILCNYIRQCALSLMYIEGPYSDASAAAMVGVAKEAKMIREWMATKKELFIFGTYTRYHKMGLCDSVRTSTFGVMKYILSNYTGNKKSFVVMDFREIMQESKRQKTTPETSDKKISQDLPREQTNDLPNARECVKSEDEGAKRVKPVLAIQKHLPEKRNQGEKVIFGKQSVEQANMLTPACGPHAPKQPVLRDERSLLDFIRSAISNSDGSRIKIGLLGNMLGKWLAPLRWSDYKKYYGKLNAFVARHPELFVVKGEFVRLHKRAKHV
ncbi:hypothetical protein ACQ4PT_062082 [Festuca glaucescens]